MLFGVALIVPFLVPLFSFLSSGWNRFDHRHDAVEFSVLSFPHIYTPSFV